MKRRHAQARPDVQQRADFKRLRKGGSDAFGLGLAALGKALSQGFLEGGVFQDLRASRGRFLEMRPDQVTVTALFDDHYGRLRRKLHGHSLERRKRPLAPKKLAKPGWDLLHRNGQAIDFAVGGRRHRRAGNGQHGSPVEGGVSTAAGQLNC